jgi:GTPase SAR1 family protein
MEEINIAVLGASAVGKSTFIQRAFDLQTIPSSPFTLRKMSIDGNVYLVRLIELTYDDLNLDDHKRICWPDTIGGTPLPVIDGVFTLYDVMNRESLVQVPETLSKLCLPKIWTQEMVLTGPM